VARIPLPEGVRYFSLLYRVHIGSGLNQPPAQWLWCCLSPGTKQPGYKAEHSPPSNAKDKNGGAVPPPPHTQLHGVVLN
jgi:hypothetical protein